MLVVGVADLAGLPPRQRRHEQAIVVDEFDGQRRGGLSGHEQDIAVLQIGVGHAGLAQPSGHALPDQPQRLQEGRLVEAVADELIEQETLDPAHLQEGIPLAADANALVEVLEVDGEGEPRLVEMSADLGVAFAQAGDLAREALDGPAGVAGAGELVDVGEVAGAWQRQPQGIDGYGAGAQFRV